MRMQAAIMYEQGKPRPYAQSQALVIEEVKLAPKTVPKSMDKPAVREPLAERL